MFAHTVTINLEGDLTLARDAQNKAVNWRYQTALCYLWEEND